MSSAERFTYADPAGNIRDQTGAVVAWADSLSVADHVDYYAHVPPVGATAEREIEEPSPDGDAGPGTSLLGTVLARSELATLSTVAPLIEGVMSYPAAVVMVGGYGIGKTFVALSFACSVATGHRWLDRRVQRRRVLFVVGEGAYGLDQRIRAWEHAWNNGVPVPDEWLTIATKPASLATLATWAQLATYATRGGYGLVVLDTFSSLAPGADETKDAAQVMRRLSDLSAAIDGCAVLVHHPGWSDSGRARGRSARLLGCFGGDVVE